MDDDNWRGGLIGHGAKERGRLARNAAGTEAVRSGHRADVSGDFDHAIGKTPFVVVPRKDADEGLVEHLGLGHVERGTVRIVVEVYRHGRRLVDADDALE